MPSVRAWVGLAEDAWRRLKNWQRQGAFSEVGFICAQNGPEFAQSVQPPFGQVFGRWARS